MHCLVGITNDLETKKNHYEHDYPSLRNWQAFGPFDSIADAQNWQNTMIKQHGCQTSWSATGYYTIPEELRKKKSAEAERGPQVDINNLQDILERQKTPSSRWYGYMFEY